MHLTPFFFFFNDTATTEIYTLSLHDALPISAGRGARGARRHPVWARRRHSGGHPVSGRQDVGRGPGAAGRSEEHTSELQSQSNLVCRLLLEKKKKKMRHSSITHDTYLDLVSD